MKKFIQLLAPSAIDAPSEQQADARLRFPELVSRSNFRLWRPGDEIPVGGIRLLLGVATYSSSDMSLLDALNERLGVAADERVDVFNMLDCESPADFDNYIPGLKRVFQSPVLGVWDDGVPKEALSGKAAADFLIGRYNLVL